MKKTAVFLFCIFSFAVAVFAGERTLFAELKMETRNIFKMPNELKRFCNMTGASLRYMDYRYTEIDLNKDGTPEILLRADPDCLIDAEDPYSASTWKILQKTFTGDYICIGQIGQPLLFEKMDGAEWCEIIAIVPEGEYDHSLVPGLFRHSSGQYVCLVESGMRVDNGKLDIAAAVKDLRAKRDKDFPRLDDERTRLLNTAGDLYLAIEFTKSLIADSDSCDLFNLEYSIKKLPSAFLKATYGAKLALRFMELEYYDPADGLFRETLEWQREAVPDDPGAYADILNNYAVLMSRLKKKEEAKGLFKETLRYYRMAAEKEEKYKTHAADVLLNYAITCQEQGKVAEAEQELRQSIALYEERLKYVRTDDDLTGYAFACGLLGVALDSAGKAEAEKYFAESEKYFNFVDEKYGLCLTRYSNMREAYATFSTRYSNMLETYAAFNTRYAKVLDAYAAFCRKKKDTAAAMEKQSKAVEIWRQLIDINFDTLNDLLVSARALAVMKREAGELDTALLLFAEILKFRKMNTEKLGVGKLNLYFESLSEFNKTLSGKFDPEKAEAVFSYTRDLLKRYAANSKQQQLFDDLQTLIRQNNTPAEKK